MLRHISSSTHAVATTPAELLGALVARFPNNGGLPSFSARSASALHFSRPAQRLLLVTACMVAKSPKATLYTGGFSNFVTSITAPIATGWSDRCRGRDRTEARAPQGSRFLRPPYDPLRSDFPSSVLTLALL